MTNLKESRLLNIFTETVAKADKGLSAIPPEEVESAYKVMFYAHALYLKAALLRRDAENKNGCDKVVLVNKIAKSGNVLYAILTKHNHDGEDVPASFELSYAYNDESVLKDVENPLYSEDTELKNTIKSVIQYNLNKNLNSKVGNSLMPVFTTLTIEAIDTLVYKCRVDNVNEDIDVADVANIKILNGEKPEDLQLIITPLEKLKTYIKSDDNVTE